MDKWVEIFIQYALPSILAFTSVYIGFRANIFRFTSQNKRDENEGEATLLKVRQEGDLAITNAWKEIFTTVIEPLKARITYLEEQVKDVETEKEELKEWAETLFQQVVDLGGKPKPYRRKSKGS